jgi:RHS repeat-associated protein
VVTQHDYQYNAVGLRSQGTDKVGSFTQPPAIETFAYDALDNRTQRTATGMDQRFGFDAANQLTAIRDGTNSLIGALVYDSNGNVTKKCTGGGVTATSNDCTGSNVLSLSFDPANRLSQAQSPNGTETYGYDDQGRRARKTVNGQNTFYLYNGPDIVAEYADGWAKPTAINLHGAGTDDPVVRYTRNAAGTYDKAYYHADGLGSVVALTKDDGTISGAQMFDSWGNKITTSSIGSVPAYGYTGREPDGSGLIYYRARYYDPTMGRFVSQDPIGMKGGLNFYAYVGNSPLNFTDPEGDVAMQAGGAIVGGLGGLLFQAGSDLLRWQRSSFADYAGAVVGGAAGGAAAVTCGPACAGAVAGAASNLTTQLIRGNGFSATSLAVDTVVGAVGGKVIGAVLPPVAKTELSTQTKGAIGEALSEVGLRATGQSIERRGAANGVGDSTFDFLLTNGNFVESKFGTSGLSGPQRTAARQQGDNLDVHYWNYDRVSGIAASGSAAALGPGSDVDAGLQSLGSFTSGTPVAPYSGSATTGFNVRAPK